MHIRLRFATALPVAVLLLLVAAACRFEVSEPPEAPADPTVVARLAGCYDLEATVPKRWPPAAFRRFEGAEPSLRVRLDTTPNPYHPRTLRVVVPASANDSLFFWYPLPSGGEGAWRFGWYQTDFGNEADLRLRDGRERDRPCRWRRRAARCDVPGSWACCRLSPADAARLEPGDALDDGRRRDLSGAHPRRTAGRFQPAPPGAGGGANPRAPKDGGAIGRRPPRVGHAARGRRRGSAPARVCRLERMPAPREARRHTDRPRRSA